MALSSTAVRRRWPRWAASPRMARNLARLDLASAYHFRAASGNVPDLIGSAHLVAGGTPTYGVTRAGAAGVFYDHSADFHRADVHDFALSSAWFAAVAYIDPAVNTAQSIVGRLNAAAATGAAIYVAVPGFGQIGMFVRDDGTNSVIPVGPGDWRGKLCLVQAQIDRTAAVCRLRVSARGSTPDAPAAGSIAGFGSLFEAGQVFGAGTLPGLNGGHITVFWVGVATGAQCEGASLQANIAGRLGFE
jgi:hypothetical protein